MTIPACWSTDASLRLKWDYQYSVIGYQIRFAAFFLFTTIYELLLIGTEVALQYSPLHQIAT